MGVSTNLVPFISGLFGSDFLQLTGAQRTIYYNKRYITIIIIREEGSMRAAKNKDHERHDYSSSR